MLASLVVDNITVSIYDAAHAHLIDPFEWDKLSSQSIFPNPFFERWNLLPACKHLPESPCYLITLKVDKELKGLFPVCIEKGPFGLSVMTLWKHNHCYMVDPLLSSSSFNLRKVLDRIGTELRTYWFEAHLHTPDIFRDNKRSYCVEESRAAIFTIDKTLSASKSGKKGRENRRILKRIHKDFEVTHVEHKNISRGLKIYCDIESRGWKGKALGAINAREDTRAYYHDIAKVVPADIIVFQELQANGITIAINMCFVTHHIIFDVKTTYDEHYKKYYPGKVLELLNLDVRKDHSFVRIDSCTNSKNTFMNSLWVERILLKRTYFFYDNAISFGAYLAHKFKRKMRSLTNEC